MSLPPVEVYERCCPTTIPMTHHFSKWNTSLDDGRCPEYDQSEYDGTVKDDPSFTIPPWGKASPEPNQYSRSAFSTCGSQNGI